jgi:hypothetical protein
MPAQELEDDRPRRKNLTCATTGVLMGGTLGLLAGGIVVAGVGALVGAVASRMLARRISVEEMDPRANPHPYVGTRAADADFAGSA